MILEIFNEYRLLIKRVREHVDETTKVIEEIKQKTLPEFVNEQIKPYMDDLNRIRQEAIEDCRYATRSVKQAEMDSLTDSVDIQTMTKIKLCEGINLTHSEAAQLLKEASQSRSSVAIRACRAFLEGQGYTVNAPDVSKANKAIEQAEQMTIEFIESYDGDANTYGKDSNQLSINMRSSGSFLDKLENEYQRYSAKDYSIMDDLTIDEQAQLDKAIRSSNADTIEAKVRDIASDDDMKALIRRSKYASLIAESDNVTVSDKTANISAEYARRYTADQLKSIYRADGLMTPSY